MQSFPQYNSESKTIISSLITFKDVTYEMIDPILSNCTRYLREDMDQFIMFCDTHLEHDQIIYDVWTTYVAPFINKVCFYGTLIFLSTRYVGLYKIPFLWNFIVSFLLSYCLHFIVFALCLPGFNYYFLFLITSYSYLYYPILCVNNTRLEYIWKRSIIKARIKESQIVCQNVVPLERHMTTIIRKNYNGLADPLLHVMTEYLLGTHHANVFKRICKMKSMFNINLLCDYIQYSCSTQRITYMIGSDRFRESHQTVVDDYGYLVNHRHEFPYNYYGDIMSKEQITYRLFVSSLAPFLELSMLPGLGPRYLLEDLPFSFYWDWIKFSDFDQDGVFVHEPIIRPQSEEPVQRYDTIVLSPPRPIVDINDLYFKVNVNYRKRSRKHMRCVRDFTPQYINHRVRRAKRRHKFIEHLSDILDSSEVEPQMFSSFIPSLTVGLDEKTTNTVSELKDSVDQFIANGLSASINHSIEIPALDNIFKQLSYCWENREIRDTLIVMIGSLSKLLLYGINNSFFAKLVAVVDVYLLYNITDTVKKGIYVTINTSLHLILSELRTLEKSVKPQMGTEVVEPLLLAVYSWMYYCAFNREYKGDTISGFLKECHTIKKSKEGATDLVTFIAESFKKLSSVLSGQSFSKVFSNNMYPQLDEISIQIQDYMNIYNKGIPFSKEEAVRIIVILGDLDSLVMKIPSSHDFVDYKRKAIYLQNQVMNFIKEIKRAGLFDDGTRIIPLCLLILGPPGVGKTTAMTQFFYELAALTMPDDLYERYKKAKDDFQYTYNPENVYFDRYRKQYFCLVDEFGAARDSIAKPNEGYLFVIRAINCWAYPVHMADLNDKGMMFDSKIVVALGNIKTLLCSSLICPEAIARRFDFVLLFAPKLEYCMPSKHDIKSDPWMRRLNKAKVRDFSITETKHIEFFHWDVVNGVLLSDAMEWKDVMLDIAREFRDKVDYSSKRLDALPELSLHCDNLRKIRPQMDMTPVMSPQDEEMCRRMTAVWSQFKYSCVDLSFACSDTILAAKELVVEVTDSIRYFVKKNPYVVGTLVAIPLCVTIWYVFSPVSVVEAQSVFAKVKTKPAPRITTRIIQKVPQMCLTNQNFDNVMNSVLKCNHYKLIVNGRTKGYFTFLKGRVGVMPHHFYDKWYEMEHTDNQIVEIKFEKVFNPGSSVTVAFSDLVCVEFPGCTDLCFVYVKNMYMHRDITKFLPSRETKLFYGKFYGALIRLNGDLPKIHTSEMKMIGSMDYSHYKGNECFGYKIATKSGECGQLLFSSDDRSQTTLLGIHGSGDGESGFAIAIFKDDFESAFRGVESVVEDFEHVQVECTNDVPIVTQMALDEKFVVVKEVKPLIPATNNDVTKSVLHNAWGESKFAPTILYSVNGLDPWVIARMNYSPDNPRLDCDLLSQIVDSYSYQCHQNATVKREDPRIFSYIEAVAGIEGYYKGLKRDTSAGYPYGCKKSVFWGKTETYDFNSYEAKKLEATVLRKLEQLKKGIRQEFIYMDHLKAERRKIEKVKLMLNRLFSASPVDYSILCRMYFGSITQWLIDNRIGNGLAVGINPFSTDWCEVEKHLRSVGDLNIFGDYKHYDGSLFLQVLYAGLAFIEKYYHNATEEDRIVRRALFEDLVNSKHLFVPMSGPDKMKKGYVYEWVGSVPSGHVLTTFINSICNNMLIRYCCCKILERNFSDFKRGRLYDLDFMEKGVRIIVYGDDNGISVCAEFACITQEMLTEEMASIGMIYTAENKSDIILGHRSLIDCTFLKCGFRYDNDLGRYVATQDLESLMDMPYWTHTHSGDPMSVEMTVDILLGKLALHGRSCFDNKAPKVISETIDRLNYHPRYTRYQDCRDNILTMDFEF